MHFPKQAITEEVQVVQRLLPPLLLLLRKKERPRKKQCAGPHPCVICMPSKSRNGGNETTNKKHHLNTNPTPCPPTPSLLHSHTHTRVRKFRSGVGIASVQSPSLRQRPIPSKTTGSARRSAASCACTAASKAARESGATGEGGIY